MHVIPRAPGSKPGRTFAAYVRVSDVRGRGGEAFRSPKQQEQAIRNALEARSDKVGAVFTDLDKSGRNDDRPGLYDAIAWVKDDPRNRGLAVMDVDRLARNAMLHAIVINDLRGVGAEFFAVNQPHDDSPEGEMMGNFAAVIAQYQSQVISRRWKTTHKQRVAEGKPSGGPIRFGYRASTDGSQLQVPDPVLGPVLAELYRSFTAGKGGQTLCRELNEAGHRTYRGNTFSTAVVLRLLDSGFGAGLLVQRGPDGTTFAEGKHQPVITMDEWKAYLRARDKRKALPRKNQSPKWWLAGIAKCGYCEGPLVVNSYSAVKSQAACSTYRGKRTCTGVWINRGDLETTVALWLGSQVDALAAGASLSGPRRDNAYAKADARVQAAGDALAKHSAAKSSLAVLAARGGLSEVEFDTAIAEINADIAKTTEELAVAEEQREALAPVDDVYDRIAQGVEGMDTAEWNALVARVINKVVVTKEHTVIHPVVGRATKPIPRSARKKHPKGVDAPDGLIFRQTVPADDSGA